jgi:hypothetical protein
MIDWLLHPDQWTHTERLLVTLIGVTIASAWMLERRLRGIYREVYLLRLITHGTPIREAVELAHGAD